MLKPSYTELMEVLNDCTEGDQKITSRYSIVIATAKRARQIIEGAPCDKTGASSDKAVSIAVNELYSRKIEIFPEGLEEEQEGFYDEVAEDEDITTEVNDFDNDEMMDDGEEMLVEDDDTFNELY